MQGQRTVIIDAPTKYCDNLSILIFFDYIPAAVLLKMLHRLFSVCCYTEHPYTEAFSKF